MTARSVAHRDPRWAGEPVNAYRSVQFSVPAHPRSVGTARRRLLEILGEWELRVDPDNAVLLLSEVLTNAILHATAPRDVAAVIGIVVNETGHGLQVEVHDPDQGPMHETVPGRSDPVLLDESGRGLDLVEALAAQWGSKQEAEGKYVYFVIPVVRDSGT